MMNSPAIPLSDLRKLWRQADSMWICGTGELTQTIFRGYVREEIARRTIAELRAQVERLTAELAERGQYEPITGHIVMVISGEIQDVQAHSISGLPLPEGHAVCKLTLHPRDATD